MDLYINNSTNKCKQKNDSVLIERYSRIHRFYFLYNQMM